MCQIKRSFLNSKEGAISFCQLAEYFMNGFKLGQTALVADAVFSAQTYIVAVSKRFSAFAFTRVSTVLYPGEYKEIYAHDGEYAQTLKPYLPLRARSATRQKLQKDRYL